MQYSIHPPTPYLAVHTMDLLPDWSQPMRSVLLVLQRSRINFCQRTAATERVKSVLRIQFLRTGQRIVDQLHQQNYLAALFDPSTGKPLGCRAGVITLDDVAIAHTILGYPKFTQGGCSLLLHPSWGSSVYPSTLVSSAQPEALQRIAQEILHHALLIP